MIRYYFVLFTLLAVISTSQEVLANHIVGGEFELVHVEDDRYLLRLIQYRDGAQTANTVIDQFVNASIFRTADNAVMLGSINIPLESFDTIPYTNVACAIGELVTVRVIYSIEIALNRAEYDDPQGYYVAYERCCRNIGVLNIVDPGASGQTYVLEFPPLLQDGEPFINSSPILFPPLSDYACGRELFYVNFEGQDPDGDSLVYSMATPINGFADQSNPSPGALPGPYPPVTWLPGFDEGNQVPGSLPLQISPDGVLRVVADNSGLYVFSILCEEFRDGERIGSVIRDFQMLVIDCPVLGANPQNFVRASGNGQLLSEDATLNFTFAEEKCFEVLSADADFGENLSIRARPVNFRADLSGFLTNTRLLNADPTDTLRTEVCLPDCSLAPGGGPMIIDFIATDDACAVPLTDTLRLTINIDKPMNNPPAFTNSSAFNVRRVREGDQVRFVATARDADLNDLTYSVIPVGFDLVEYGVEINELINEPGEVSLELVWDTDCQVYDFISQDEFLFRFLVSDTDSCGNPSTDEIELQVAIELPPNTDPVISTTDADNRFDVLLEETIDFTVRINDADDDFVVLDAIPVNFDFDDYQVTWAAAEGQTSASEVFRWYFACTDFTAGVQDTFLIDFIGNDLDKCKEPNNDTLRVEVVVSDPGNPAPQFEAMRDTVFRTIRTNELLREAVVAIDPDVDPLRLDLLSVPIGVDPSSYTFTPIEGIGRVVANLELQANCNFLEADFAPSTIYFRFRVEDVDCLDSKSDTLVLALTIEDIPQLVEEFIPANVFTPNGDALNNVYYLDNLPLDNCESQFRQIRIYDRWGKEVYISEDRNFRWDGTNSASGVYYYFIDYTESTFKGTVSILR